METEGTETRKNDRLLAVFAAAPLLWCAWWYCRAGDPGLLVIAGVCAAVAAALPRTFPGNARWLIWTTVLVGIVCFSANVSRVTPPEEALGAGHVVDRTATVAYAIGLSGLFFRMHTLGVTKIMIGCVPLVMRTLGREGGTGGEAWGESALVWGFVACVTALDHLRQTRAKGPPGAMPVTRRDRAARGVWLFAALALGVALCLPVRWLAFEIQHQLYGMVFKTRTPSSGRVRSLPLNQSLPSGFHQRTRLVLLVQARTAPQYVRESVYTLYQKGKWLPPKAGEPLPPVEHAASSASGRQDYLLWPQAAATADVWRVEVLAPRLLVGICAPGSAVTLSCEGRAPLADGNGMVTVLDALPPRYEIGVTASRWYASAYPFPDGSGNPAYTDVPVELRGAASNWVAACGGFAEAASVGEAAACLERYFYTNFTYRTDVKLRAVPDPLSDFMARREGFCTHFASAATLMFRSQGIPARLVGGFAGGEWSPWLKRWAVRERAGHAWAEVWDAAAGRWLLVEATPPGGRPEAAPPPGVLRQVSDLLVSGWKRLVFALTRMNVFAVLGEAGAALALLLGRLVRGPVGVALFGSVVLFAWWRRRAGWRRLSDDARLRSDLTRAITRRVHLAVPERLWRQESESWDGWIERMSGKLPETRVTSLREDVEKYQQLRYKRVVDRGAARAWLHVLARRSDTRRDG